MTQRIIHYNDFRLINKSFNNQPKDTYNYISTFLAPEVHYYPNSNSIGRTQSSTL